MMKLLIIVGTSFGLAACSADSPKADSKPKERPEVRLTDNLRPYAHDIRAGHELRKKLGGSSVNYGNGQYVSIRDRSIARAKMREAGLRRNGIKK
jgi:hypothetical protein